MNKSTPELQAELRTHRSSRGMSKIKLNHNFHPKNKVITWNAEAIFM